jgi:hypothetical protein
LNAGLAAANGGRDAQGWAEQARRGQTNMAAEDSLGPWVPILPFADGGIREQVEAALDDIAVALAPSKGPEDSGSACSADGAGGETAGGDGAGPSAEQALAAASARGASLADGPAGTALFYHYLDQARPGRGYDEMALEHLEAAIAATAELVASPGLYGGFSGVAWALEHLTGRLLEAPVEGGEDPGEDVARALGEYLSHTPWLDEYDLIGGLVGYGVWAIERGTRSGGQEAVASIVQRLAESAERHDGGIAWRTSPARLQKSEAEMYPDGYINTGVAHGVPGVIGVLGAMCARGLGGEQGRELLEGAVTWLLGHGLPPGMPSRFGYNFAAGATPSPARLAWCYGDPGIAASLLLAARATGDAEWERQALDIGRAAAERPRGDGGVTDGGLCHGAAGLVNIFNRLYQATRDPRWRTEALYWVERLMALRQAGEGVAGWRAWRPLSDVYDPAPLLGWRADPGFLTGAAGVGLALLGVASPVEPAWDLVLLASVPPAPATKAGR